MGYLCAVFTCLPSAYAASNSVIWERGDQIVQLVQQDDDAAAPNDHPTNITPDEVEAMLETLRLRYADEDPVGVPLAVFTRTDIDNLGKALATGLDRATPSQDLIFHVISARRLSAGAFARRNRVCAGRVFYRNGKLNIIFGQIQTSYRKKNVYGQIDQDFYPRNYGSRTTAAKHNVVLLAGNAATLHKNNTGTRDDWIVMEPGAAVVGHLQDDDPDLAQTSANSAAPVALAEAPTTPLPLPDAHSTDIAKGQPEGMGAPSSRSTENVEERLKALKQLRERELISEDAYQAKMKEILQDL